MTGSMSRRIPDAILDSIRERISIVDVVSAHVALRKAGRNFLGLCPFHQEKTPSFTVSEERGLFHCFGCGQSGTAFSFIMRVEGLDFVAAVEQLARKAGVALPEDGTQATREVREKQYRLHDAAQRRYVEALRGADGAAARTYLEARGTAPASIERFGLGFCPHGGSGLIAAMQGRARAIDEAIGLGLVGRRSDGGLYERQWGRITFPIRDAAGRIVGFGGRAFDDRQPKYLNSPESSLFHKGRLLYGLFEARSAIRGAARVVIVEGYMDVLALAQHGIENVVANLGTALTEDQLRLAKRQGAAEIVVFFDGDRAGRSAALRTFELCATTDMIAFGAFLPEGEDPDSFVRGRGAAATRALVDAPVPLSDYFLDHIDPGPDASLLQRREAARRVADVLRQVRDPIQFGLLARIAADRLGLDESAFRELRRETRRRDARTATKPAPVSVETEEPLAAEEATLLEAMALGRDACEAVLAAGTIEERLSPAAAAIARDLIAAWDGGGGVQAAIDVLPPALAEPVGAASFGAGPLAHVDRLKLVEDCLSRIERRRSTVRLREARERLRHAERVGDVRQLFEGVRETHRLMPIGVRRTSPPRKV